MFSDIFRPSRGFEFFICRLTLVGILFGCHLGCSSSTQSGVAVSGKVTVDGEPLARGKITFSQPSPGAPVAVGEIIFGKYSIPAKEGPWAGKQTVQVVAFQEKEPDPTAASAAPQMSTIPSANQKESSVSTNLVQYLPAKFNTASTLVVELKSGTNADVDLNLVTTDAK